MQYFNSRIPSLWYDQRPITCTSYFLHTFFRRTQRASIVFEWSTKGCDEKVENTGGRTQRFVFDERPLMAYTRPPFPACLIAHHSMQVLILWGCHRKNVRANPSQEAQDKQIAPKRAPNLDERAQQRSRRVRSCAFKRVRTGMLTNWIRWRKAWILKCPMTWRQLREIVMNWTRS